MGILKNLFGGGDNLLAEYISKEAIVIDVRSQEEYASGHVSESRNLPLQQIEQHVEELRKLNQPIILCCASGMRSGRATKALSKHGLDVINGGSWQKVEKALKNSNNS